MSTYKHIYTERNTRILFLSVVHNVSTHLAYFPLLRGTTKWSSLLQVLKNRIFIVLLTIQKTSRLEKTDNEEGSDCARSAQVYFGSGVIEKRRLLLFPQWVIVPLPESVVTWKRSGNSHEKFLSRCEWLDLYDCNFVFRGSGKNLWLVFAWSKGMKLIEFYRSWTSKTNILPYKFAVFHNEIQTVLQCWIRDKI